MTEQLDTETTEEKPVAISGAGTAFDAMDAMDDAFEDEFSQEEMEAFYFETMQNFAEGEVVQGTVVEIAQDRVLVDIGYKSEGVIPKDEFSDASEIAVGDVFDVYIEEPEDENGMPVFSKIKADRIKNWTHIQRIYEEDGSIEGLVTRRVKGGLKIDIGIDAFMPASQLTWLKRFVMNRVEL